MVRVGSPGEPRRARDLRALVRASSWCGRTASWGSTPAAWGGSLTALDIDAADAKPVSTPCRGYQDIAIEVYRPSGRSGRARRLPAHHHLLALRRIDTRHQLQVDRLASPSRGDRKIMRWSACTTSSRPTGARLTAKRDPHRPLRRLARLPRSPNPFPEAPLTSTTSVFPLPVLRGTR